MVETSSGGPPLTDSGTVAFKLSAVVPLAPSSRSGGRYGEVVAGHCRMSPACEEATFQGQVSAGAPEKGGCKYTDSSIEDRRVVVVVSLLEKGDSDLRFRRPRAGFAIALPPIALVRGLATHDTMRCCATFLRMSQDITCRAFDEIPIAQFPDVLMTGPVAGSRVTSPSRTNSKSRASQLPMPGLPSLASQL